MENPRAKNHHRGLGQLPSDWASEYSQTAMTETSRPGLSRSASPGWWEPDADAGLKIPPEPVTERLPGAGQ